jgi:hypothetical protein
LPQVGRLPRDVLSRHPVDVLVLGDLTDACEREWITRVELGADRPRIVFEFWEEEALFRDCGPVSKSTVTLWSDLGYATNCRSINSTQVGGVVDRYWLVVVRYQNALQGSELEWPRIDEEVKCPMSNCLRTTGIPGSAFRYDLRSDAAVLAYPGEIVDSERDSMPAWPGSLICTPRGTHRLLNDELARGLGTPKTWLGTAYPRARVVQRTPAVHILEFLGQFLIRQDLQVPVDPGTTHPPMEAPP